MLRRTIPIFVLVVCGLPIAGGCTILGFLMSPSASEQKIPARFRLADYEDQRLYLVVRGTRTSGMDVEVPELLSKAICKEIVRNVKWPETSVINAQQAGPYNAFEYFSWTQVEENARREGAAFLLYVEVIEYELIPISSGNYWMGKLAARAILLDAESGQVLWPDDQTGRILRTAVDFEKKGRTELLWRLTTAAAHCVVREFYDCPKQAYKIGEEVKSIDTMMKDLE